MEEKVYHESTAFKPEAKEHKFTVEFLYHFRCCACGNWWSWASTPPAIPCLIAPIDKRVKSCPHCGHRAVISVDYNAHKAADMPNLED